VAAVPVQAEARARPALRVPLVPQVQAEARARPALRVPLVPQVQAEARARLVARAQPVALGPAERAEALATARLTPETEPRAAEALEAEARALPVRLVLRPRVLMLAHRPSTPRATLESPLLSLQTTPWTPPATAPAAAPSSLQAQAGPAHALGSDTCSWPSVQCDVASAHDAPLLGPSLNSARGTKHAPASHPSAQPPICLSTFSPIPPPSSNIHLSLNNR
jgi:hypothetical protein